MLVFLGAASVFFLVIAGLMLAWWLVDVTLYSGYEKKFRPYVLVTSGALGAALNVAYNLLVAAQ